MPTGPLPPSDNYLGDGDRTTGEFQAELNNLQNWARQFQAQLDALSSTAPGEAFNRAVGDSAGQLTARGVGTGLTQLVETAQLNTRLSTAGNLGSAAVEEYEVIDVTLTNQFNNTPVRFARIGTHVTLSFLEAPTFTASRTDHTSSSDQVPASMRWTGATAAFSNLYGANSSLVGRILYRSSSHDIRIQFFDWAGIGFSTNTGAGINVPVLSWNTGA